MAANTSRRTLRGLSGAAVGKTDQQPMGAATMQQRLWLVKELQD